MRGSLSSQPGLVQREQAEPGLPQHPEERQRGGDASAEMGSCCYWCMPLRQEEEEEDDGADGKAANAAELQQASSLGMEGRQAEAR